MSSGLSNLFRVAYFGDSSSSSYAPHTQTQTHLQNKQLVHHSERVRNSPLFDTVTIGVSLDTPLIGKIENEIKMNDLIDQ